MCTVDKMAIVFLNSLVDAGNYIYCGIQGGIDRSNKKMLLDSFPWKSNKANGYLATILIIFIVVIIQIIR